MKSQNSKLMSGLFKSVLLMAFVASSCTKTRKAELADDVKDDVYAISEFGDINEKSAFTAQKAVSASTNQDIHALDLSESSQLSTEDVNVPSRLKFMFSNLPVTGQSGAFKITFSVDKKNVTAYKVVDSADQLTAVEKSLAISAAEARLAVSLSKNLNKKDRSGLQVQMKSAQTDRQKMLVENKTSALLVPLFKYEISEYGILERSKNDLNEQTSRLVLKSTDWDKATHIKISSKTDARKVVGMDASEVKSLEQIYQQNKIENRVSTAEQISSDLKIGLNFLDKGTRVITKLDAERLLVYEITDLSKLTETQMFQLKNKSSDGAILSCHDKSLNKALESESKTCVIVLVASTPVSYKKVDLKLADASGFTSSNIDMSDVPMSKSTGLVEIKENSVVKQEFISGVLDPNNSIKVSQIIGKEFFFRRTFEDAATSFLGRTGTSGDMVIVKFELDDDRLVVRNQMSLIQYTGQGAKDREEILSIPVIYIKKVTQDSNGSILVRPRYEQTSKEMAEYIKLDWTNNKIPDASSPLAFFDAGSCFIQNSSQKITDMDMRLAVDGTLNFSISSSYTVQPGCAAYKDVNSAYWAGMQQFNYNVIERLSFVEHKNKDTDNQFTLNISPMAQEAFNFGVFTLADKVTENGTLNNMDGSEKYLPMVHDLRNNKTIRWYLGGINNNVSTPPERRKLLVETAQQVIKEWNETFTRAFKGTSLERTGANAKPYVELVVEDAGKETGHLGDLDKNYIWYNEIPADNGLLGVAQPAANPRSGAIESANVIVYTGNTYDQVVRLMKFTKVARGYEKMIEQIKTEAVANAAKSGDVAGSSKGSEASAKASSSIKENKKYINSLISYFKLDNKKTVTLKQKQSALEDIKKSLVETERNQTKIDLPLNSSTLAKKITELAMNKKLVGKNHEFELKLNDLFLNYGNLPEDMKAIVQQRQQMLALSAQFDKSNEKRAGCFLYARNDIEDIALGLTLDENFRNAVMSTLSHELGHAFGLLHNFIASMDKENYEFKGEATGRNYSSIMDYISDIDMHYAGPGPYDVHAIRAAYTGQVELSEKAGNKLASITDIMKAKGDSSFVHYTKSTLNQQGLIKHYAQCSDGGMQSSILCNQFDSGSSATEIVKTMIADYNRGYAFRNYVYDRIQFNWPQKIQMIQRNIGLFTQIRAFLDETIMASIYGVGRPENASQAIMSDLVGATLEGYKFFIQTVRTPDAQASFADFDNRFTAIPYEYSKLGEDGKEVKVKDIQVLESRSTYDVGLTKEKMDTLGIYYDKIFAMNFLMQTSTTVGADSQNFGFISYKDFERAIGANDPRQSLIMSTMQDILSHKLNAGFFSPSGEFIQINLPIEMNKSFSDQVAISSVIGLNESKWSAFDSFAESLKVARSSVKFAPRDRLNVTRLGQDRKLSDTTVFYAPQNAVLSANLVQKAALSDTVLSNKQELVGKFLALAQADMTAANDTDKEKANKLAQDLILRLRALNKMGALMPVEMDAKDQSTNFEKQIDASRKLMMLESKLFSDLKKALESSPVDQLQKALKDLAPQMASLKSVNDQLAQLPAILISQLATLEISKSVQITLQNKQTLDASVFATRIFDATRLETENQDLVGSLDFLSQLSGYVDPDLNRTK